MSVPANRQLQQFVQQHNLEGLSSSSLGLSFRVKRAIQLIKLLVF